MKKELKKISVQTIGCRLNQYESEKMAHQFYPYGFERVNGKGKADLYIINTCTVTHRADSDCRQMIRKAVRQNPNSRIIVSGCYVDNDPEKISGMEGVDLIIHNQQKDDIIKIALEKLPALFSSEPDKSCSTLITDFHGHNRAWLKVSDGCNQWCSFCIIPTVRGRLRNRTALEIVEEINMLVESRYKEIVLTGIHLGHYKNRKVEPQMKNLAALIKFILKETDLYRLRLSSVEPQTFRKDLLEVYADSNGRICRHIHLPLQAGSSRILKLMLRPYDQKTYISRVEAIRKAKPETIIGADVIVGFPGETENDFKSTKNMVESGLLDYLHVFSYSDRPDTPASKLPDKVDPITIKERNAVLSRISADIRLKSNQEQVGQVLEVIGEHKETPDGHYFGYADNFVRVKFNPDETPDKNIIKVKISDANQEHVTGDIIS